MDNTLIAQEWFKIADMDLASAEYLQTMHPVPIEIICWHCQQAVEKYLKGFLALNGHELIKTHDLVFLNKTCLQYDARFNQVKEECLRLTDYGVNIRYPYPMDLNETDMRLAIRDAERVKEFITDGNRINLRS